MNRIIPMMKRLRLACLSTCLLLAALVSVPTGYFQPTSAQSGNRVCFNLDSNWGTGAQGTFRITNSGASPITNWRLEFDFPHNISSIWDARLTSRTGNHYVIDFPNWNPNVAPGATVSFGFISSLSGTFVAPTNFRLNGAATSCTGSPTDTQAPTAPTNLRVTATTTTSVSLAWNASTDNVGVVNYEILRGGAASGTSTTTSFTVTGLTPNTTYTFTVRARDAAGNVSPASSPVNATTQPQAVDTQAPTVPANLRVTGTTSSTISLAWNPSTDNVGVTEYDVRQGTNVIGASTTTSFIVSGLAPSTTYSFSVRARDAAGNLSAFSSAVSGTTQPAASGGARRIVGYFAQWGIYARQYFVKNIDTSGSASKLTHINYAFTNVENSRPLVGCSIPARCDGWADYQRPFNATESVDGVADTFNTPLRGNWGQLKKLKARYPNLKVMISFGGWTWSGGFSDAALPQNRQAFVAASISTFIDGNLPIIDGAGGAGAAAGVFDGIDLDWEYPIGDCSAGNPGCIARPEDPQNFVELVAEFRRQLDAKGAQTGRRYELTLAVAAGVDKIQKMVIAPLAPNVDFISVMTFDFFGAWNANGPTAHQSALFPWAGMPSTPPLNNYNVDFAIQEWKRRGIPANKLVMAVPFYGRGWTGVPNINNGLNQSATGPAPGAFPEEPGNNSYRNLSLLGYPSFRDPQSQAYWIYNGSTFWTLDDPVSITNKAAYVKSQGLGGMMFWNLTDDTPGGALITAIFNGLR